MRWYISITLWHVLLASLEMRQLATLRFIVMTHEHSGRISIVGVHGHGLLWCLGMISLTHSRCWVYGISWIRVSIIVGQLSTPTRQLSSTYTPSSGEYVLST